MELQKGLILIELDWIGEGWSGDYDSDDHEDDPLLRFDVYRIEDDDHVTIDDASYCTRLPDWLSDELKMKALEILMAEIYEPAEAGYSIKKLCEKLSWIGPDWLEEKNLDVSEIRQWREQWMEAYRAKER